MKEKINKELIDEITLRLVKVYKPLAIYLFGSYVWGNPSESSDVDFFIIVDNSESDPAERIRIGLRELKDIRADVDLLVFTAGEVNSREKHPSTLTHKIITRGVKVYAAA